MQTTGRTFNLTANGDTEEVEIHGACHYHVSGNLGGGTMKLMIEDNDGNFQDIASTSVTGDADQIVRFPQRSRSVLKANLAGATTPAAVVMIRGEIF